MADDLELLRLAFSWHMAREVVASDAHTSASERMWLRERFPRELLVEVGLVDAAGVETERSVELRERARDELRERLTTGEKLALVEDLLEATAADGHLAPHERGAIEAAATILGLSPDDWGPLVDELLASGRVAD
jgi:uncharacterized tellurite resistance protein B-like protein